MDLIFAFKGDLFLKPKKAAFSKWNQTTYEMLRGIPLLANRQVGKIPFHVFDRYEIHIQ